MATRDRLHILVLRPAVAEAYTSYGSGRGSARPPAPIRSDHGSRLIAEALAAERLARMRRDAAADRLGVRPTSEGLLITFESWPGFDLELTTFDPLRGAPELIAVRLSGEGDERVQIATVYVPDGSLGFFLKRFEDYLTRQTPTGKPRFANMVERIAALRLATVEALWTDDPRAFPSRDEVIWWEVWLRASDGREVERLRAFASREELEVGDRQLVFDNRVIVLIRADAQQMSSALEVIDDFAELRAAHSNSSFFTGLSRMEQSEWVEDLVARTRTAPEESAAAACVLDTGINRAHPLLEHSLDEKDMHACGSGWGTHDHDGHGTNMAGLALYGDLKAAIEGGHSVTLRHRLESVKILPPVGDNDPDLYGAITAEAVARVEVEAPRRRRVFSMAVTAQPDRIAGTPTSWSASVDALAAGRDFDTLNRELRYIDAASVESHRLFLISAGNVRDPDTTYLDRSDAEPVEDPAQAWNALTVGAYTDLVDVAAAGPGYQHWTAIAPPGDLSPFSRTSVSFQPQWPTKPDVVMEGGNAAVSPTGTEIAWPDSLGVLTTAGPLDRLLTTANATSAATAEAAFLAASITTEYPAFWPETVRALIVHAAEWTPAMIERFSAVGDRKRQREALARRYGFGVPTLERCLRSATNAVTLIVQDTIRPFSKGKFHEMHIHDLPWPRDVLADLGEVPVRLRVTLSYFIEPSPTRRGWRRRYRYASHQMRYELQDATETNDDFRKRINKLALDEEEERPSRTRDAAGWFLGSDARFRGSLHSDFWEGTAADLAARGRIAVYPVTGWWKELRSRDRSHFGARYALLMSIEAPVEDVDLWTPIAQEVGLPIAIET